MSKYYIIYETKNLKNGMTYIGMHETNNLEDGYLGSGKRLKRAIKYYGKEFFERRVLHLFDNREGMVNKEIELVTEDFINREDTYNLVLGGKGGNLTLEQTSRGGKSLAYKLKNDEEFAKLHAKRSSDRMYQLHKEGKIKIPNWKGKNHSEETKAKMRKTLEGKHNGENNSQYGTCWVTNGIESKKIFKEDSIPDGWKLGRKIN